MRQAAPVLGVIVLLASLTPAAAAEPPGRATLVTEADVTLAGLVRAAGPEARVNAATDATPFLAEGVLHDVVATYVRYTVAYAATPDGGVSVRKRLDAEESVRTWTTAAVAFEGGAGALRAATTEGGLVVASAAVDETGHPVVLDAPLAPTLDPLGGAGRLETTLSAGWALVGARDHAGGRVAGFPSSGTWSLDVVGPATLELSGGRVSLVGEDGAVERYRLGAWRDGEGPLAYVGLLTLQVGSADWSIPLHGDWTLGTPRLALEVDGVLTVPDASGDVEFGGTARRVEHARVVIDGALVLAPRVLDAGRVGGGPRVEYAAQGDFRSVAIDGRPAVVDPALASLAAGAGGAALLAWWFLYHRVEPAAALANPMRRRILEKVKERPGIHLRELGRELDLTWGRLLHHVDVLRRARHVMLRAHGRYRLVFPTDDAATPTIGLHASVHPLAREIVQTVIDEGAVRARDLQDRLGVSRQRLAYHLKALQKEGQVSVHHHGHDGLLIGRPDQGN